MNNIGIVQPLDPVLSQALVGILHHHIQQLSVGAPLGENQIYRSPAPLSQPVSDQLLFFHPMLQQNLRGNDEGRLVKLLDELPQHQAG